jgi:hypothetical protein
LSGITEDVVIAKERWVGGKKKSANGTVDGSSTCTSLLFACDGTVLLGVGAASAPLSGLDALRQLQRPRCCYALVILDNPTGRTSAGRHCCTRHGIPMLPSIPKKQRSRWSFNKQKPLTSSHRLLRRRRRMVGINKSSAALALKSKLLRTLPRRRHEDEVSRDETSPTRESFHSPESLNHVVSRNYSDTRAPSRPLTSQELQ